MSLSQVLDELSADATFARIEHITREIPSRLAGSENSRRMAEYARDALAEAGLKSRLHEFPGLVSIPSEGTLWVLGPEARTIEAFTLGHSASTGGVEGELVYVASGAEADYGDRDVGGKIILTELSYSPARHEKAYIAWQRGAAGAVMMNWGDETNTAVPFGSMKSAWGNPTPPALRDEMPDIPCIGVARTEGLRLKAMCAAGPVRVRMRAAADNAWRPLAMTSGETGTGPNRPFLLIGGHMDSWFGPQATDNAAGDACMIELARVYARHQDNLRRGLVVGLWMGHETGTMISSSRFADVNWDRLRSQCVGYLQIDQPACSGTSEWHLHSTDDVQAYLARATREVVGDVPVHWGRMQKNGDSSFFGVGLPSFHGEMSFTAEEIQRTALATLGWWHHSIHNTLDKVDRRLLALHLRVYARWMWDLMTLPVLPFEYKPVAARFVERLRELAALDLPEVDMEGAATRAAAFLAAAERLDAQSQAWAARTASTDLDAASDILNAAMVRLSRLLVPVVSTVAGAYGQDRYGHAWQTEMIPTLVPYRRVAALPRDGEEFRTWWVAMVRARNRVADALSDATRICDEAVARLRG